MRNWIWINVLQHIWTFPFVMARKMMGRVVIDGADMNLAYSANVAMLLSDHYDGADFSDPEIRERAAQDILWKIFRAPHTRKSWNALKFTNWGGPGTGMKPRIKVFPG